MPATSSFLRKVVLPLCVFPVVSLAQLPAFPGAQGAGSLATGGRGGDVYHVINLNDDGAGSLRDAIGTAPANGRTIVFDVSGTIALSNRLKIDKSNLTIAGQTAPGQGICIKGRTTIIGSNLIIRHLHFRPHETTGDGDAVNIGGHDIIIDHCSASWSSDEVMSTEAEDVYNITVQWSCIYEGLNISYHYENGELIDHSMGSLFSTLHNNAIFSVHHNLYAHNRTRNPKPTTGGPGINLYFDFTNNVVYDWGTKAGYSTEETDREIYINYKANYLIAGPSTKDGSVDEAFEGMAVPNYIYQEGNKIDGNRNGIMDGVNTGWNMITGIYSQVLAPFAVPAIKTTTADDALADVLDSAGALWWNRDAADLRVTNDVRNGTGKIIDWPEDAGGWPNLAVINRASNWDTDGDGMPNSWELLKGSDPSNANDRNGDSDGDGYTNLEEYLNAIPYDVIVPLELIDFSARLSNNAVVLAWKTAQKDAYKNYTIEKSARNGSFYSIAEIAASGTDTHYYTDLSLPTEDVSYYRLKCLERSGKIIYSAVRKINRNKTTSVVIYPNPARDKIFVSGSGITNIQLFNPQGVKVREQQNVIAPLLLNGLPAGVYFIKIYTGRSSTVEKIEVRR